MALEVGSKLRHEFFAGAVNGQLDKGLELSTFNTDVIDLSVDAFTETTPNSTKKGRIKGVRMIWQQADELLDPGQVTIAKGRAEARASRLKAIIFGQHFEETIERRWMLKRDLDLKIEKDLLNVDTLEVLEARGVTT